MKLCDIISFPTAISRPFTSLGSVSTVYRPAVRHRERVCLHSCLRASSSSPLVRPQYILLLLLLQETEIKTTGETMYVLLLF